MEMYLVDNDDFDFNSDIYLFRPTKHWELCQANDTEFRNHEYFLECARSAKRLGSFFFDKPYLNKDGGIPFDYFIHLANQLKNSDIEDVYLTDTSLNDEELITISAVLKYTKIKNLNLERNKFGMDGFSKLLSALTESKVQVLDLSGNKSIRFEIHNLADSLPLSNVTSIDLGYININFSCLKHLADALASTKITVLSLNSCYLKDESIKYLSQKLRNSKIQSLDLAFNDMSFDGLKSLADVLENTAITELDIHRNEIGSTGAKYLAGKLSKSILEKLDIGGNNIKSEGCSAIGDVIHLTKIIKLNLEHNSIDSSGIKSLAENLKESKVKHLNLNENELGIDGAKILANGIKDTELEYLNLDCNQLRNIGMGFILDALQFTKITDFTLDGDGNRMKAEDIEWVTNAFQSLKLTNLELNFPYGKNTVGKFFTELNTLIESDKCDEILPIKNKMNLSVDTVLADIRDEKHMMNVIKHFHMKKLVLTNSSIDINSISSLVTILIDIKNPISNITTLNLSDNSFGDEGAIILAKHLKNLKLTTLILDNTEIKNDGVIAIAKELKNSQIRYLNLRWNYFDSIGASYLTDVVKNHPVRIILSCYCQNGFSAENQLVINNINYMFLKAQFLVRSISDNRPVKYDKHLIQHLKAYEIFKNVDSLWESEYGKPIYDYNRINSEIRSNVTRNFLKIMGFVNSDEIISDSLPTEMIIKICSYLKINDIKFK